jgi:SAM-dependent methyltransferase
MLPVPRRAILKKNNGLRKEFETLWQRAEEIWTANETLPDFGGYVSAEFSAVLESLIRLKHRTNTFLEWGSGLGVVAQMAARLGYEAYGIEAEPLLVDLARELAAEFDNPVEFVSGSFVPDKFEWQPELGQESERTVLNLPDAYAELGFELRDFDLVYAYPWPTEHELLKGIMRHGGGLDSRLLIYDAREGVVAYSANDWNN